MMTTLNEQIAIFLRQIGEINPIGRPTDGGVDIARQIEEAAYGREQLAALVLTLANELREERLGSVALIVPLMGELNSDFPLDFFVGVSHNISSTSFRQGVNALLTAGAQHNPSTQEWVRNLDETKRASEESGRPVKRFCQRDDYS